MDKFDDILSILIILIVVFGGFVKELLKRAKRDPYKGNQDRQTQDAASTKEDESEYDYEADNNEDQAPYYQDQEEAIKDTHKKHIFEEKPDYPKTAFEKKVLEMFLPKEDEEEFDNYETVIKEQKLDMEANLNNNPENDDEFREPLKPFHNIELQKEPLKKKASKNKNNTPFPSIKNELAYGIVISEILNKPLAYRDDYINREIEV
ncbi:MAG: hypothetical protein ABIA04_11085 [Pseudomonadota bacterium]